MKWLTSFLLVTVPFCSTLQSSQSPTNERWVLTSTRVYVAPDVPAIDNGWVIVAGATIEAVGEGARPAGLRINSACSGGVIVAGFQNSHVHFTDAAFADAATRPAANLEGSLTRMLTRYGFTTVVDTGSLVDNTVALRQRIDRGDVRGPAILTTGIPIYPPNGIPFYLRDLPPVVLSQLPQPTTTEEALAVIRRNFASGANGTKLFLATPQGGGQIKRMPEDIARAAVTETHARDGLVMAHPTDPQGVRAAVAAGVDIVVHTTIDGPRGEPWSADLLRDLRERNVSVIPTLRLWRYELDKAKVPVNIRDAIVAGAEAQIKAFAAAGGQVLFGTDVGYMSEFDPADEYALMASAGLTPTEILASLTTAPAARWKAGDRRGRVKQGFAADLAVLNGDPATDVGRFGDVKCTIRGGRELFARDQSR
jgi:imidazolonepropionase-like amidohydrolase